MPRAKRGTKARARRNKILKAARGMVGSRHAVYKVAQQSVFRAMQHAFAGRKQKKRDYRSLWIVRINAACRGYNVSYSRFMHGLKIANIDLNRKSIADMAINDLPGFGTLVEKAKSAVMAQ
jgi:large subunit ribosomal protein L20